MSEDQKKDEGMVDKFILGAIIGGAIGSVLGVALAPKSGKENRKTIIRKYKEIKNKFLGERSHGTITERAEEVEEKSETEASKQ